ncbi:MAG: hypothetical protein DBX55_09005 [Verrucomicrobia bacterium]|nr:MAG: hypothetical protein DBX55_09005 [Verrucomicrobiota bacterium]
MGKITENLPYSFTPFPGIFHFEYAGIIGNIATPALHGGLQSHFFKFVRPERDRHGARKIRPIAR